MYSYIRQVKIYLEWFSEVANCGKP